MAKGFKGGDRIIYITDRFVNTAFGKLNLKYLSGTIINVIPALNGALINFETPSNNLIKFHASFINIKHANQILTIKEWLKSK